MVCQGVTNQDLKKNVDDYNSYRHIYSHIHAHVLNGIEAFSFRFLPGRGEGGWGDDEVAVTI